MSMDTSGPEEGQRVCVAVGIDGIGDTAEDFRKSTFRVPPERVRADCSTISQKIYRDSGGNGSTGTIQSGE
jgi:hypothetical protein